jgi:ABC-type lipoprotein release transport system permease subunit
MLFKLAYRNIWRNKRRTLITAASVMFAGLLTISLTSIETGMWEDMLQAVVDQSTGQIQLQSPAYFDEPTIDNSFKLPDHVLEALAAEPDLTGINPRIENFTLAAHEDRTRPVLVIGVDPSREDAMTGLSQKVSAGQYLASEAGSGILVGTGLADRLGLSLGDSMVFFGQGFRGAFSVGMLPVRGKVRFPLRELNNQLVFINLNDAWELFQADQRYTSVMLRAETGRALHRVTPRVNAIAADADLKAYRWEELIPELLEAKQIDEASTLITMYILYLIVSFGIFGTLLMLLNERQYEMGVLVAIGMKRQRLMAMIWMEFMMMALLGMLAAMVLAFGVVSYLRHYPIPLGDNMQELFEQFGMVAQLTATIDPRIFVRELLTVTVIVSLLSLYPIWKIHRLNPIAAMRS